MTITDPAAFVEALLADPEFRRELEEEGPAQVGDLHAAAAGVGWRERGVAESRPSR